MPQHQRACVQRARPQKAGVRARGRQARNLHTRSKVWALRALASAMHQPSRHSAAPPSSVTIEFQRQQAKEMQKYFRRLALEEEVAKAQCVLLF